MRTDERRWTLVRTFYRSYRSFHALLETYERRVQSFVDLYGKDRQELKLNPDELLSLFDSNALSALHDEELLLLKDLAHQMFRGLHAPDPFDSHLTNIYHEVSLLKEEHWAIREEVMRLDRRAYDRYYREVNVFYPRRLRHVRNLFGRARKRLETVLLSAFARNKIMVRSVYLFGERLVQGVYRGGLVDLYALMYPNGGALTGYTLAADSFVDGGFAEHAAEAYDKAVAILDERVEAQPESAERVREDLEAQRQSLLRRRERATALD